MEEKLELLSKDFENVIFRKNDIKVGGSVGSKLPVSSYYLEIPFRNHQILIKQELGNYNLGSLEVSLEKASIPNFTIINRNHLINLFLRKKNILKVNCENQSFKLFLENLLEESNLEKIAKENLFEPNISTKFEDGKLKIITTYHLEFEDKIGALKALINFYQKIISY